MSEAIAHVTTWALPQLEAGSPTRRTCLSSAPQQASGVAVSTPVRNPECDEVIKSQSWHSYP